MLVYALCFVLCAVRSQFACLVLVAAQFQRHRILVETIQDMCVSPRVGSIVMSVIMQTHRYIRYSRRWVVHV
ncbi:hypothetical protein B0T22DRAFT_271527 [Podospora appendiculata]|uniref:Secreted protein n=1 Tax=Podospora appendiculata TaxID=314037 RepID=A0AAE1C9L6_9PEZI|nr:hypothetical protein B0T22DRAFT_271527 [Podospora appendiculata]